MNTKGLFFLVSGFFLTIGCNRVQELGNVNTLSTVITDSTFIVNAEVVSTGGDKNATRGVCWGYNQSPTTSSGYLLDANTGKGVYSVDLFTEIPEHDERIYVRSFVQNEIGISYGNELMFTTPITNRKNAYKDSGGCVICDDYEISEKFKLDGEIYEVVNYIRLRNAIRSGSDVTLFCTSKIEGLGNIGIEDPSFNQDIGSWDVSNLEGLGFLFYGATSFNQDISNWDVSNVVNMNQMFSQASSFNQDIGSWDVSNVKYMEGMFWKATLFDQDLSNWCVSQVPNYPFNFSLNSSLSNSDLPVWGTCP